MVIFSSIQFVWFMYYISIHLEKLAVRDRTTRVDQIILNLWHTQTHNTRKSNV